MDVVWFKIQSHGVWHHTFLKTTRMERELCAEQYLELYCFNISLHERICACLC